MSETVETVGTEQQPAAEPEEVAEAAAADPEAAETEADGTEGTGIEKAGTEESETEESETEESETEGGDTEERGDEAGGDDVLVREGDIAGDYLERLLDLLDFDGDIDLDVEAGRAIISIDGGEDLEQLVGSRGQVLEALQELTRLAVQQETAGRSRLMLDIGGWRADRREELRQLGTSTAEKVVSEGERVRMQPMSPFERKVVHDAVAAVEGARSESEGEEPKRRVVVLPE